MVSYFQEVYAMKKKQKQITIQYTEYHLPMIILGTGCYGEVTGKIQQYSQETAKCCLTIQYRSNQRGRQTQIMKWHAN